MYTFLALLSLIVALALAIVGPGMSESMIGLTRVETGVMVAVGHALVFMLGESISA